MSQEYKYRTQSPHHYENKQTVPLESPTQIFLRCWAGRVWVGW